MNQARNRIAFSSKPLLYKHTKPNLYGSGKLADIIHRESSLQDNFVGLSLLAYYQPLGFMLSSLFDKRTRPENLDFERHIVHGLDGGDVGVDIITSQNYKPNPELPNIFHFPAGLTTSRSPRTKIWASWFLEAGYPKVVVGNLRGNSRVKLTTPQISLPFGKFNEVPAMMDYFINRYPTDRWILTGSCYGAHMIWDYFATHTQDEVIGGVVDSFQFDGERFLNNQRFSKQAYCRKATIQMMNMFVETGFNKMAVHDSERIDFKEFCRKYEHNEMVDKVYEMLLNKYEGAAPSGANSAEHFHAKSMPYYPGRSKNFMNIKKPFIAMYAQDDPFCPFDEQMIDVFCENPMLALYLFAGGGHIGFPKSFFPYYKSSMKDFYLDNFRILAENNNKF